MTSTPPLIRVALYLRADTMVQAARQAALLAHAADRVPNWRLVGAFCDLNFGAGRPGRSGAISAAQATGFNALLVRSMDRLTRNADELWELIGQLTAADVTVHAVSRPNGPQGEPEIVAVDTLRLAVYRELARSSRPVLELLAGRPPTGEER